MLPIFGLDVQADDFLQTRYGPGPWKTQRVDNGFRRMRDSSVLVCGLAQNLESILPFTINRIEFLASYFSDYRVLVYENDSCDATPQLLANWAASNERIVVIRERLGWSPAIEGSPAVRYDKMATFRNRLRKELSCERYDSFDTVIMFDLDLYGGFSLNGIADSFSLMEDADLIGANGLDMGHYVKRPYWHRIYYDSLAYRSQSGTRVKWYDSASGRNKSTPRPLRFRPGTAPVPVSSCFGGMAIYRRQALVVSHYDGYDCEHICLHDSMLSHGYERMFINPAMVVLA